MSGNQRWNATNSTGNKKISAKVPQSAVFSLRKDIFVDLHSRDTDEKNKN